MLDTALSILAAIALLMPGFIVAELSLARSVRPPRSDMELALRSLAFTLIMHVVFALWTAHLIANIGSPGNWPDHVGAVSLYVATVLLAVPVLVGVGLNRYLASVEARDGLPNLFAAGLGAGEASDAFDYARQRWQQGGTYVIVEMIGHSKDHARLVGGMYGSRSAVGKTPSPHDIYLEALCTVSENDLGIRSVASRAKPQRGVYIAAAQIARIDLVPEGHGTIEV